MATAEATEHGHAHDEHGHDHPEWLEHHYETPEQQFEAAKLGMWLFLAQEVLFFTGLFVAYAVYRMNHPEVFTDAAEFLNPTLGALNTIVLLASSLAIAWAVRCAQKNQQEMLLWLHVFTLACAGLFMGVKIVEYSYKFDEGLFWVGGGTALQSVGYAPQALIPKEGLHANLHIPFLWSLVIGGLTSAGGYFMYRLNSGAAAALATAGWGLVALLTGLGLASAVGFSGVAHTVASLVIAAVFGWLGYLFVGAFRGNRKAWGAVSVGLGLCILGMSLGIVIARGIQAGADAHHDDHAHAGHHDGASHDDAAHDDADHGDAAHGDEAHGDEAHSEDHAGGHDGEAAHGDETHGEEAHGEDHASETTESAGEPAEPAAEPTEVAAAPPAPQIGVTQGNFFSIYFAMTGVHALHIFAGIVVIAWIIGRIARGDFSPEFYGPVEFVGLYWHLVDLVWIYLFPLLYLI